jgi:hypothetical protein
MAKVLKIKRDALAELGEGFEVLTDAEVTESGITLADDEVLVFATPQPSANESEEVKTLKGRLHTVNQESAQRRIALKEAQTKLQTLEQENTNLKTAATEAKQKEAKQKAQELYGNVIKDKKLVFLTDDAGNDFRDVVFASVDWQKEVTKEILAPLVDDTATKKKHLLKTVELPPTQGGAGTLPQGGTEGLVDIDLEQIAQEFNLPYQKEGAK